MPLPQMYQDSGDVRISDAAKGCLLQLGLLDNRAAVEANNKIEGQDVMTETYDVFLSHKVPGCLRHHTSITCHEYTTYDWQSYTRFPGTDSAE